MKESTIKILFFLLSRSLFDWQILANHKVGKGLYLGSQRINYQPPFKVWFQILWDSCLRKCNLIISAFATKRERLDFSGYSDCRHWRDTMTSSEKKNTCDRLSRGRSTRRRIFHRQRLFYLVDGGWQEALGSNLGGTLYPKCESLYEDKNRISTKMDLTLEV